MSGPVCAACHTVNAADARFCEECGSVLERHCLACGTKAGATARFCRSCGNPLGDSTRDAGEAATRRIVTVLFADLVGSTEFEERVDPETAREVIGDYHGLLRSVATRHRAGVVKYIGDGFMAVWGVHRTQFGDAGDAVEAAVELQRRFVELAEQVSQSHGTTLALRVAVNTGEVVVGAQDADLVGDALNVASRLESACPPGEVVVGEETWRATRQRHRYESLGPLQVKGHAAAVSAYRWEGLQSESADSVGFVGRSEELRRLDAAVDEAVARNVARLVTVIGDPGVGKSRLAAEFVARRGIPVIHVCCDTEDSMALAPVIEMLRARDLDADIPATVPERERILGGLRKLINGVTASVEETFWALRRFIEVLAAGEVLSVVVEDIQWAGPLLLDFLEHLAEWVRDTPVIVIALADKDIRDNRAGFARAGGWVADVIELAGLDPEATTELAGQILADDRLPADLLAWLPRLTDGSPLFVREVVGMLVDDGVLVPHPDGWRLTIDVDAISVPPTVHALLASRLERTNSGDRRALEIASVIGTEFSPGAVAAVGGLGVEAVSSALERLHRLDFVLPGGVDRRGQPLWCFRHALIRDVAYRRLLKSDRAELHERIADWVDGGGQSDAADPDEVAARHVEAAYGYRCDLGMRDARTASLGLRAARSYLAAARRALDSDALVSAGIRAVSGAALATEEPALQAELLQIGCEALLSVGDIPAAAALLDQLDAVADDASWATCYRCQILIHTEPSRLPDVEDRLGAVIEEFVSRGDAAGSAKAYLVRASARALLGRVGDCELDLSKALVEARRVGDRRLITATLAAVPDAALWGPSPVPKAGGRCRDALRIQRMTGAAPSVEAMALRCLGVLEMLRGRPDEARKMLDQAREIASEVGLRLALMETELYTGIVELMAGNAATAEPHLRIALEGLDVLGVGSDAGSAAALLARSLLAQGRVVAADHYVARSKNLAGSNVETAIAWRAVSAEILSAQGRHADAAVLAREAVAVAANTDLVADHAEACLALGRVLEAGGDTTGADQARSDAESLYAAKEVDLAEVVGGQSVRLPGDQEHKTVPPIGPELSNRATDVLTHLIAALRADDVDSAAGLYAQRVTFEDLRAVSEDAIADRAGIRVALLRLREQYGHIDEDALAVRGDRLLLTRCRCWDDLGNETAGLILRRIDRAGEIAHEAHFDESDFWRAYRELETLHQAGGGGAGTPSAGG